MAELVFFTGPMGAGKSTLALQMNFTHIEGGRQGVIYSKLSRDGAKLLTSRIGLKAEARDVNDETKIWDDVSALIGEGKQIDYLICDESQFYTVPQIEHLARIVDMLDINVYAFGITTDFKTHLFPGSSRLIELADRVETIQVITLCWCGKRGTHNARVVDNEMVVEGEQVVIGDTANEDNVRYEVLCRKHHMQRNPDGKSKAKLKVANRKGIEY